MVTLDVARTEKDVEQCRELLAANNSGGEMPMFGAGTTTFIVRDSEDEPEKIRGLIHCRLVPELTHMITDKNYRFQQASYTLLAALSEAQLRIAGHTHCYHSISAGRNNVIKMVLKSGAVEVTPQEARILKGEETDVRLRKELA